MGLKSHDVHKWIYIISVPVGGAAILIYRLVPDYDPGAFTGVVLIVLTFWVVWGGLLLGVTWLNQRRARRREEHWRSYAERTEAAYGSGNYPSVFREAEGLPRFDSEAAMDRFEAMADEVRHELGPDCRVETGNQDCNFHGLIWLPRRVLSEDYTVSIRASDYGYFITIYDTEEVVVRHHRQATVQHDLMASRVVVTRSAAAAIHATEDELGFWHPTSNG